MNRITFFTIVSALFILGAVGATSVASAIERSGSHANVNARLWLAQGRMDAVLQWVEAVQLPLEGPLAAGRESEYLFLARFLIVAEKTPQALELLARLRSPAQEGKRLPVEVEINVLEALAWQGQGKIPEALEALKEALKLVESTGLLRVFIGDGALLSSMLKKIARD